MSFPTYSAYKDSGVEWLGEVPEHWNVAPLGLYYEIRNGFPFSADNFTPEGAPEHRLIRIRDILGNDSPLYTDESCPAQSIVENGDILIGMDGDFNTTSWAEGKAKLNQRVCAVRGRSFSWDRFFFYGIGAPLKVINDLTFATTVKHLASSQILKTRFPIPPETEMENIACFLDHETARIDALIEEQQRLIELLKEKRQAVISHAVTKGLDPTVPMQDSGLDWLGEVPAHWQSRKVKRLFKQSKRQGYTDMAVLSVYRDYGVIKKSSRDDNNNKTPDDLSLYQLVEAGDLVVNKMKAWQGSLGVSEYQGITSPDYVVYSPLHSEVPKFLHYLLRASHMPKVYLSISNGIRPSQWRIEPEKFEQLEIPLPDKTEQLKIVGYLESQITRINELMLCCDQASTFFSERRSALISAAVTGKIDVRGWQPPTRAQAPKPEAAEAV